MNQLFDSYQANYSQICYGPLCGGKSHQLYEFRKKGVKNPKKTVNVRCRKCNDHLNDLRRAEQSEQKADKDPDNNQYDYSDDWLAHDDSDIEYSSSDEEYEEEIEENTEENTEVEKVYEKDNTQTLRDMQERLKNITGHREVPVVVLDLRSDLTEDSVYRQISQLPKKRSSHTTLTKIAEKRRKMINQPVGNIRKPNRRNPSRRARPDPELMSLLLEDSFYC